MVSVKKTFRFHQSTGREDTIVGRRTIRLPVLEIKKSVHCVCLSAYQTSPRRVFRKGEDKDVDVGLEECYCVYQGGHSRSVATGASLFSLRKYRKGKERERKREKREIKREREERERRKREKRREGRERERRERRKRKRDMQRLEEIKSIKIYINRKNTNIGR